MRLTLAIALLLAGCGGSPSVAVPPVPVPTAIPEPVVIATPRPTPALTATPTPVPVAVLCPQYAPGTDPLCYGLRPCPVEPGVMASPLPLAEINALVDQVWTAYKAKFDSGELKDLTVWTAWDRPSRIRWEAPPTVSVCWSALYAERPMCVADQKATCTGKIVWYWSLPSATDPWGTVVYRIAIRTDVPADVQRELIVDGVRAVVLMGTGRNTEADLTGPIGLDIRQQILGK